MLGAPLRNADGKASTSEAFGKPQINGAFGQTLTIYDLRFTIYEYEDSSSNVRRCRFLGSRGHIEGAGPRAGRLYDAALGSAARHQQRRKRRSAALALLLA